MSMMQVKYLVETVVLLDVCQNLRSFVVNKANIQLHLSKINRLKMLI
jgi:hypothetical protein